MIIRLTIYFSIGLLSFINKVYSHNLSAPSAFIENKGQITDQQHQGCPHVKFLYNNYNGFKLILGQNNFSYECYHIEKDSVPIMKAKKEDRINYTSKNHRIDIRLIGANLSPTIIKENPLPGYDNYYTASAPAEGILNVKQYKKITYQEIYPHINLIFYLLENKPKYEFVLHPGAVLSDIRLQFSGALSIRKNEIENIEIMTSLGKLEEAIPVSYIMAGNTAQNKTNVEYSLNGNIVSFRCADWNTQKTLIIDPVPVLDWGTYYGPSYGQGITVDQENNVIVGGMTLMDNSIIVSTGAHQSIYGGGFSDCYIAKFTNDGVRLWGTYYGGEGDDRIYNGVEVDSYDNVIVSGCTSSTVNIATPGAYQTTLNGPSDHFIAKFTKDGVRLWATYCGGNGYEEYFSDAAIDPYDNIILFGSTFSNSGIVTPGAYQSYLSGSRNCYLTKFTTNGNILWATYYGGDQYDISIAVTTDKQSNIIFTGETSSTINIASPGAHQTTTSNDPGEGDAFLVKMTPAGTRVWGTYYGGYESDFGTELAIDSKDNIILTGQTLSIENISTPGAYQLTKEGTTGPGGSWDSFLTKFDPSGNVLWGTYFGGVNNDFSYDVTIDTDDNIYITGETDSYNNIATSGAYKGALSGPEADVFLAKFDSLGSKKWGTYYGGSSYDVGWHMATDYDNNIFITGYTQSTDGISTSGAYQEVSTPSYLNTFVAKFSEPCTLATPTVSINGPLTFCSGNEVVLTTLTSFSHTWSTLDTSRSIHVSQSGSYFVSIDSADCKATSNAVTVSVYDPIPIELGADQTICDEKEIIIGKELPDTRFIWSTEDTTAFIKINQSGLYKVTARYKDCPAQQDSVSVKYINSNYRIANLITNNGDGKNDAFLIEHNGQNIQIYIYNRWGETVYENSDYKNDWIPEELTDGVYYYEVKIDSDCGNMRKGWLQIVSK
ncbi:MAG TPA: gliding motility-associated C-terminal domain-containing protein [Cytophagaceae bacterium]|jgi:hypothetical protein|nr:gliding motility-associated C-terminal domain-containing protein [Cytophagaceae bacterium]